MDFNGLLDLIARLFVIIGVPAAAIWAWYSKSYAPARLRENETKLNQDIKASDDTREYEHGREVKAFSHTVLINESLVQFNIKIIEKEFAEVNQRLDAHEKQFYTINQHIARGAAAIENVNRDRVADAEIKDDIDIELHAIKELLRAALAGRNGTPPNEH